MDQSFLVVSRVMFFIDFTVNIVVIDLCPIFSAHSPFSTFSPSFSFFSLQFYILIRTQKVFHVDNNKKEAQFPSYDNNIFEHFVENNRKRNELICKRNTILQFFFLCSWDRKCEIHHK